MDPIKVWGIYGSPPVNSVLFIAKALNLQLDFQEVDFSEKEFLEEWFLKMNPSHTVPLINDNGFILWDSHAIARYLVKKYAPDRKLYPEDIQKSARIDQILEFDCGKIFHKFSLCCRPLFYEGATSMSEKALEELKEVYEILNRILENSKFLAGSELSLADISVLASVAMCDLLIPITDEFPKFKSWFDMMRSFEFFEAGKQGIETFKIGLNIVLRK